MDRPFPAYRGSEPFLFVSYSHESSDLVYPELERLSGLGYNIWYDEGINPGSTWRDELAGSIKNCHGFVLFVTDGSARSEHCINEVNFALEETKPVLAIHLQETQLPDGLRLSLSGRQAILKYELRDDEYEEKIRTGLGMHIESSGQSIDPSMSTSPPVRNRTPLIAAVVAVLVAGAGGMYLFSGDDEAPETEVQPVVEETPVEPASPQPRETSIAVLPFVNMSNDPNQEFFSDGLSEDILNGLVTSSDIKVIARTSSFQFKGENRDVREIGRQLGVTHVLEGSVRKAGNQIRVTAQLIATDDGSHLWSGQFDRTLEDVFAVQDEVTGSILSELNVHFTTDVARITPDSEAYVAYLTGRHHFNRFEYELAGEAFRTATVIDPEFAAAHAGLASTELVPAWWTFKPAKEAIPAAKTHIDTVLQLSPDNADARTFDVMLGFFAERRYQDSLNEIVAIIAEGESGESDRYALLAVMLHTLGFWEQAVEAFEAAIELDPLSPMLHRQFGEAMIHAGDLERASRELRLSRRLGFMAPALETQIAILRNDTEALASLLYGEPWGIEEPFRLMLRATAVFHKGDSEEAQDLLNAVGDASLSPAILLWSAIIRGEYSEATALTEQAISDSEFLIMRDARHVTAGGFGTVFTELKNTPEYQAMLRRVGLDDESVALIKVPNLPVRSGGVGVRGGLQR